LVEINVAGKCALSLRHCNKCSVFVCIEILQFVTNTYVRVFVDANSAITTALALSYGTTCLSSFWLRRCREGGSIYNRYLLTSQRFGLFHAYWSTESHSR
jgi:hypothetical protein